MLFIAIFTRFKSNLKLLGALLGKVKEVSQSAHEKRRMETISYRESAIIS